MKKIITTAALALLLAFACFALFACGGEISSDDEIMITYYMVDGDAPFTTTIERGDSLNFSQVPRRDHYKFLGLFDQNGAKVVDEFGGGLVGFSDNVTLRAKWSPESYTVKFDLNGGVSSEDIEPMLMVYGDRFSFLLPEVEKDGYDFVGWFCNGMQVTEGVDFVDGAVVFTDKNYYIEDGKVNLVAQFEEKRVSVTFDFNDGETEQKVISLPYGQEIPEEEIPLLDTGSEKITGWSTYPYGGQVFSGVVTEDVVLYPIWQRYKVIEFYLTAHTNKPDRVEYAYENESFTPYTPEKPGYDFDGWYDTTLFSGIPVNTIHYGMSATKLYAKWNLATYTLSFETNNGTELEPLEYTIFDELELPVLTKENFTFLGWCVEEDLSDSPRFKLTSGSYGTKTLYAKFKGDDKTAILDAGLGTVPENEVTVEYSGVYTLPVPKYDGYEFQGWFTGAGLDAVQLTDKDGVSFDVWPYLEPTTVYAQYKQKFFVNVTVNIEGAGSYYAEEYYIKGDVVSLEALINDGYEIVGWFKNGNLVSDKYYYEFLMGEENVNLELRFEAHKFLATLDKGDGICKTESKVLNYGEVIELPVAYKPGYLFVGWEYDGNLVTDESGVGLAPWKVILDEATFVAVYREDTSGAVIITDAAGLLSMSTNPGGYYVLVEDIDLAGVQWTPFEFKGTLLGNGCVIKNLTVQSESGNLGMFTRVTGTVKDIKFEKLTVTSTSYASVFVGGLCAELAGGTVSGIEVRGELTGDYCRIGGIVGKMSSGSIKNCINYASVTSETFESAVSAGGIVSLAEGGEVVGCKNYGTVSIGNNAGGVIGVANTELISSLENFGSVSGKNQVGGVIGLFQKAGSYVTGGFTNSGAVKGDVNVGGVIGQFINSASWNYNDAVYNLKVSRVSNTGRVEGKNYVGGCIGYFSAYIDGYGSDGYNVVTAIGFTNTADVVGTTYVGGLFGYAYSDTGSSAISNSSSSANITAEAYVGGLGGRVEGIGIVDSSNAGSTVTATYYYLSGSAYYAYVGGYVGYGYYVENCENAVPISYTEGGMYVGGIAGRLDYTVKNCKNTAPITASASSYVGGIVGEIVCNGNYEIVQNTNTGAISGNEYVGGVIGSINHVASWDYNDNSYNLKITKITNKGSVTGTNQVGGCIGRIYVIVNGYNSDGYTKIIASVFDNTGDVSAKRWVGGLIGYAYSDTGSSQISNGKSRAKIEAECYAGALAGQLENIMLTDSSNAGSTLTVTSYYLEGSSYYAYVGAYVGYGYYVENCHNAVEIIYPEQGSYVGGIAGRLLNAIKNCSNSAQISASTASYVGGIVGEITCTGNYEITELENSGAVTGKDYVSGVIGSLNNYATWDYNDTAYNVKVNKIKNFGAVVGGSQIGGVIGRLYLNVVGYGSDGYTTITANNIENNANIKGFQYVGGLIGYAYSDYGTSQLMNCSSAGEIEAEAYLGGLAGRLENVKLVSSSNEGTHVNATYYSLEGSAYYAYVGGYVGYGYYVENCHNAADITYTSRGSYVGGIAGRLLQAIQKCSNSAKITASAASYVGGLVGEVNCTGSYEITELENSGAVVGADYVGGIIGSVNNHATWDYNDGTYNLKINKIKNTGAVSGKNQVSGCIGRIYLNVVGYGSDGSTVLMANNFENLGAVTGVQYVGGFIGYAYSDNTTSQLSDSTNSSVIEAEYHVGAAAGKLENVRLSSLSNEGSSVTATNYFLEGSDYYAYVGGYVGHGYYIENCDNAVEINYTGRGAYVGGIAGRLSNTVKNSANTAKIYAPQASYVGGLVGEIYTYGSFEVSGNTNSGAVTGKNQVGGLIGQLKNYYNGDNNDNHYDMRLVKLTNTGNVVGEGHVGGLIGYIYADILGWSSSGSVIISGNNITNNSSVTGTTFVGALIGEVYTDNASSMLSAYDCAGTTVNGVAVSDGDASMIIAKITNLTLTK